jgi:ParB family chromosome partitioning protein
MNAIASIVPAAELLINNMASVRASLRNIGIAPENPRFNEPADDGIPNLAATLLPGDGAGLMIPLFVRSGRAKEQPWMALDGRRRLLGYLWLVEQGLLTLDHEIDLLICDTKEQQARATVLLNTEHLQPHPADKIRAIGNLTKKRMNVAAIAKALGYDETDVKKYKALADVHPVCLDAYRDGRITLDDLKLLARLPDASVQKEWGEAAFQARYFNTSGLRATVQGARVDINDARFTLVTTDAYIAAGGRLEQDLFSQMADRVLDPEILETAWRDRVSLLTQVFADRGIEAFIPATRQVHVPDGHSAGRDTPRDTYYIPANLKKARAKALDHAMVCRAVVGAEGFDFAENLELVADLVAAEGELCAFDHTKRELGAVSLFPDRSYGVRSQWSLLPVPVVEPDEEDETPAAAKVSEPSPYVATRHKVTVPKLVVDTEGLNNALHERRTDMGTKGLIRDLADKPTLALVVLIAQMFKAAVINDSANDYDSASRIRLTPFDSKLGVEPRLDGEVRLRLIEWGKKYAASGLRPIPFIHSLAYGERMTLLAEMVAISLDLREHSVGGSSTRRAEAAEIAELTSFDICDYYTIGGDLLAAHPKKLLLGMLGDMQVQDPNAEKMKKGELVALVEESAAEHRYAPKSLNWLATLAEPVTAIDFDDEDLDEGELEDQDNTGLGDDGIDDGAGLDDALDDAVEGIMANGEPGAVLEPANDEVIAPIEAFEAAASVADVVDPGVVEAVAVLAVDPRMDAAVAELMAQSDLAEHAVRRSIAESTEDERQALLAGYDHLLDNHVAADTTAANEDAPQAANDGVTADDTNVSDAA